MQRCEQGGAGKIKCLSEEDFQNPLPPAINMNLSLTFINFIKSQIKIIPKSIILKKELRTRVIEKSQ